MRKLGLLSVALCLLAFAPSLMAQKVLQSTQLQPLPFSLGPVYGFGDYHAHQMGQLGFGGRHMYGSHDGAESVALKSCTGTNHAVSWLPVAGTLLGQPDLGQHPGQTHGYGTSTSNRYKFWPTWINTTHQGYWKGWLYKAYQDGLRLFVMSAVNFDMFCSILPQNNTNSEVLADLLLNPQDQNKQCDDMVNIKRQIRAARKFDQQNSWYEIAESPADARRIINEGKMAVVLAVEASKIWGSLNDGWPQVLARLNELEALGVRSFQVVHEIDNNVGGPAYFHFMFDIFSFIDNSLSNGTIGHGIQKDSFKHNQRGLTYAGEQLVRELINRKLIVDSAHLSERSVEKVYQISAQNGYYPMFVSHGHYRDLFHGKHADEKKTPHYLAKYIKATGGVFGLRTGPERVKTYAPGGVANNCHGSSRSFAQSYLLGTLGYGLKQGFGVDMTGMIAQMRPRFYDSSSKWSGDILHGGRIGINSPSTWACGAENLKSDRNDQRAAQGSRASSGLGSDFDLVGFGHIGQIKDVIRDLNKIGVDTGSLEDSAENFVAMWERAHSGSRSKLPDSVSTSGIDHGSLTDFCPGNIQVDIGPIHLADIWRREQVGSYQEGVHAQPKGGGIPNYVPICKANPHLEIQEHNCSDYGFKHNGWCIQRRDGGEWYSARELKEDLCPVPHSKQSGKYGSKIVCKSGWDGTIQRHNCSGSGKSIWGNWCVVNQESYYVVVREIVRDLCPVPYRYETTHSNGKILCKPTPHFKIKASKCSGDGGSIYGGYCIWNQGFWYKARETK